MRTRMFWCGRRSGELFETFEPAAEFAADVFEGRLELENLSGGSEILVEKDAKLEAKNIEASSGLDEVDGLLVTRGVFCFK